MLKFFVEYLILCKKNHSVPVLEGDNVPYFAQDMKGAAMQSQEVPEWKKATFGGKGGSYGRKTNLSILEQRQGLPIYKLRNELVKVWHCLSFFKLNFLFYM